MDTVSLVLDPSLGLDVDEFVAVWNADIELRGKAEAGRERRTRDKFFDSMLAQGLVSLAVSVAGGIASGLILDFIRKRPKTKNKEIEIIQVELPGGKRA